jgi:DNA gyrase subunit B
MMWLPTVAPADFANAEHMRAWSTQLEERLKALNGTGPRYRVHYQAGTPGVESTILVTREYHGLTSTRSIHEGFFRSPEYDRIALIGTKFKDLLRAGASIARGKDKTEVATVPEAIEWLMTQAKQGQTIQRYKGLGEMNPAQLWETTVNPQTRRLMQVRIEDAVAADEVFTTLMGDQVEPRREFIERNALSVANLDV